MEKCSEKISEFLNFLKDVEAEYPARKEEYQKAEEEMQDLLHCLEDGDNSYRDIAKIGKALVDIRQRRRVANNAMWELGMIVEWKESNEKTINELKAFLGEVRKVEKKIENKTYFQRTDIVKRIKESS